MELTKKSMIFNLLNNGSKNKKIKNKGVITKRKEKKKNHKRIKYWKSSKRN